MHKVLLDVNVVVDFLDEQRSRHHDAVTLLEYFVKNSYEVCLSEDMLSTIYYVMKDKRRTLEFFREIVFKKWQVFAFGKAVCEEAAMLSMAENIDFEDLLQCLCAKANRCELVLTSDKGFVACGMEVMSIDQFFSDVTLTEQKVDVKRD